MAITDNDFAFFLRAREKGVSFGEVMTLGRLNLYASKNSISQKLAEKSVSNLDVGILEFETGYSESLFKMLGAETADSIDFSDYENATFIHDMNQPIPDDLKKRYSLVIDGGTVEHIFNFPTAIKNGMEMVKVGGHYIGVTPANNTMGHGFYQFSPELYYRIFSEENGFEVTDMFVVPMTDEGVAFGWYKVPDPIAVNSRIYLTNSVQTQLYFCAKRISEKPVFAKTPQQSDYAKTWAVSDSQTKGAVVAGESGLKTNLRKYLPKPARIFAGNIIKLFTKEEIVSEDMGKYNPAHFVREEI